MIQLAEIMVMILHGCDAYKFYIFKYYHKVNNFIDDGSDGVGVYMLSLFKCFEF